MADSVFLVGKIIETAEAQGAASSIQREINSAKSAIDTFNQNSKLIIDIDTKTAARISVMKGNLETITKGLTELKQASTSFQNIEIGIDRLINSFDLLGNTAKEVSELMIQKIRPALNIPDTTIKSVESYAAALQQIANNAGALSIIKKTPAVSVTTPTSPTSVPTAILPMPAGTGTGGTNPASISANKQAAEDYKNTLENLYNTLFKVFEQYKKSSGTDMWKQNKQATLDALEALMKFHEETNNVFAQGKQYEKAMALMRKEGVFPVERVKSLEEAITKLQIRVNSGKMTEERMGELLKNRLNNLQKLKNIDEDSIARQERILKLVIKESDARAKSAMSAVKTTADTNRKNFYAGAGNALKSGDAGVIGQWKDDTEKRIFDLKKQGNIENDKEIRNLEKILGLLKAKKESLEQSLNTEAKINANLALSDQFLNGKTQKERNIAGAALAGLKVREQELLYAAAKDKYGRAELDQLQRRLGLQRGVSAMLMDELRNWPAMLGRQIMYGIQWTVIFGTIHRIQQLLVNSLKLFGEFERGTSKALRTGLTPAQLSGAFTSEANKGTKETVNHYRELLQVQAMVFTSKHKASVEDYMGVVYELTSANMSLAKAMQFADTTMKVSIAAEGNMRETARTMAGMYNIYGKSIKGAYTEKEKFNQIANVVLLTWSREQMELSELNNALKYVAASGRAMDIDYRVLITTIGHLNTQMVRGATAGTGLRQMMAQTSKDVGGIKESFSSFSDVLVKYSQQEKMAFDPQKPMDFINVLSVMRKNLLKGRKDFVDYGQDIVFTADELSEAYKIMSLRGANVGLTLLRTLPELKKKLEETLNLTGDYIDNFIKMQEMNIPTQWGIMVKNLTMLPAAFLLGATHTQSIAEAMSNINESMANIIVGAFIAGKVISGWGQYLTDATAKLDSLMEGLYNFSTSGVGKYLPIIGGLGFGGPGSSPGLLPAMYMSGKQDIAKKKSEVEDPKQFIKNIQTSAGELLKYIGVTKEAQKESDKTFDLGSKKFLKNLEERITNTNIETESWIKKGDYISAATGSLRGYTQIYKELNAAYDISKMGKVAKEFERQTALINGLNKAMEGQVRIYAEMKSASNEQRTVPGWQGVRDANIQDRQKLLDDAGIAEKIKKIKDLEDKDSYLSGFLPVSSSSRMAGRTNKIKIADLKNQEAAQWKLLPEFEAKIKEAKANNEQREKLNKELSYYANDFGLNPDSKSLRGDFSSRIDAYKETDDRRQFLGSRINDIYNKLNKTPQANIEKLYEDNKNYIISQRKKVGMDLSSAKNQIPADYFMLIKDKALSAKMKKQEDMYLEAHEKFLKETNPLMKSRYKTNMDVLSDNINTLLLQSPQFMSVISGVLLGEKESDKLLAELRTQMDINVSKTADLHKEFRDKLYKEIGMPGLNKDQKETLSLKDQQNSTLGMLNATIREKAQNRQNLADNILKNTPSLAAVDQKGTIEMQSNREYYSKMLAEANVDYTGYLTMRQQLLTEFTLQDNNLQLDQKRRFDALFLTEDGKKREAIKENYRKLMDEYRGDDEKIRQLQRQQNKELAELAVEQADKYIKERQRALDEVKKIKEEEIKHAQKMADQALEIEKQKNLGMVKAAALAEIERLKATGKATPENVKKIMEKMDASVEAMTGKYDIKGEELKQSQAEQDIIEKQGQMADLRKRYNEEKARMEKADKALKGKRLPKEEEIDTQEYKDREDARKNANDARAGMLKLIEEINQAGVDIETSKVKVIDINTKQEEKILTETDLKKQKILKDAYGITTSVKPLPDSSGNVPSVRPGTGGGGSGTIPVTAGIGGGTSSVDVFNKFKEMENPWNKEEITLGRLKTARESRLEQLRKEIALMGKIGDMQKFGDMELGSFKNVGKVPGSIGQSFARILANQVPVPKLAGDLFSKDKALWQIDAAIKAKENGGLDAGSKGGVEINITIGDNSNPSKLPGHIENNLTMIGKQITEHFENLGVG